MTPHGDTRRYRSGCRCAPCRGAWRVYMKAYRAGERTPSPPADDYLSPAATTVLLAIVDHYGRGSRVTISDLIKRTGRARSTVHHHLANLRARGLLAWDEGSQGTMRPTCAVHSYDERACEQSATLSQQLSGRGAAETAPGLADTPGGADMAGLYPGTPNHAQGRR